jgi:hypothetical protein
MTVWRPGRPSLDGAEAILADRYLESLLEAAERHAVDVPADPALDPALRATARRLRDEVVRAHPSFRFEERLGRRLAEAAGRSRLAAAAGAEDGVLPFRVDGRLAGLEAAGAPGGRPRPAVARPLVIGGALTSAALSLAGACLVAWRMTHGSRVIG